MSKSLEVIHNILGLLPTIEEGINYIKLQIFELRYEESFTLLQDVIMGISSIESAIRPMESKVVSLQNTDTIQTRQDLKRNVNEVITIYENKKYEELERKIGFVLETFIIWRETIELILIPTIVS